MIKWLLEFFDIKPNDWKTISSYKGIWDVETDSYGSIEKRYCFYEIQYSNSRRDIRVKYSGYQPHEHGMKSSVLEILAIKNRKLLLEEKL